MVQPLDAMLTAEVAPALRGAGFKRKGRRFVLTNELGDQAVIEVSTHAKLALGDGWRHFWVLPWLLPEPHADLWRHRGASYAAGPEQGLSLWGLPAPPPFRTYGIERRLWSLKEDDPDHITACGRAVADALVPGTASTLLQLLDRDALLEELRRSDVLPFPGPDDSTLSREGFGKPGTRALPLLADAGDTPGVASLLGLGLGPHESWLSASRRGLPVATALIDWLATRLAERDAPNLHDFLAR